VTDVFVAGVTSKSGCNFEGISDTRETYELANERTMKVKRKSKRELRCKHVSP
jgi:hypothetical protein